MSMLKGEAEKIIAAIPVFPAAKSDMRKHKTHTDECDVFRALAAVCGTAVKSHPAAELSAPQNKKFAVAELPKKFALLEPKFYRFATAAQDEKIITGEGFPRRNVIDKEIDSAVYAEKDDSVFFEKIAARYSGANISYSVAKRLRKRLDGLKLFEPSSVLESWRNKQLTEDNRGSRSKWDSRNKKEDNLCDDIGYMFRHGGAKGKIIAIALSILIAAVIVIFAVFEFRDCRAKGMIKTEPIPEFYYNDLGGGVTGVNVFSYGETVEFPSETDANSALKVTVVTAPVTHSENSKLKKVVLPKYLEKIGDSAFLNCTSLEEIDFPSSLRAIGKQAFMRCTSLKSVTIPAGVTEVGFFAFSECTELAKVELEGVDGNPLNNLVFRNCEKIKTLVAPAQALYCVPSVCLETVTVTGGERIEIREFYDCETLKSVTFPDSLLYVGQEAFYRCVGLKDVELPQNVQSIGDSAFSGCENLSHLYIPQSVTSIGKYAFALCEELRTINYGGKMAEWYEIEKGEDWDIGMRNRNYTVACSDGDIKN